MRFDIKLSSKEFNIFREFIGNKDFLEGTLKKGLKNSNLPSNAIFLKELYNSGIIIKISSESVRFADPFKPIYYATLEEIYKTYNKRTNSYYKAWIQKKKRKELQEKEEIQKAIQLLKDNGYLVIDKQFINM